MCLKSKTASIIREVQLVNTLATQDPFPRCYHARPIFFGRVCSFCCAIFGWKVIVACSTFITARLSQYSFFFFFHNPGLHNHHNITNYTINNNVNGLSIQEEQQQRRQQQDEQGQNGEQEQIICHYRQQCSYHGHGGDRRADSDHH